ncbi:MAG TPA: GAF domain-containing sensor histidine kinase, partial [Chloroflexota bacterium]
MSTTSLRLWAVVVPTFVILLVDHARHLLLDGWTHPWQDEAALVAGVLVTLAFSSHALLGLVHTSQRREREAEALRRIGVEVASTLKLDAILGSVLSSGRQILDADCVGVVLAGTSDQDLVTQSRDAAAPVRKAVPASAGFISEAIRSGLPAEGPACDAQVDCPSCRACLAIPLKMGSEVIGAMCFEYADPGSRQRHNPDVATQIASLASVGVANALLHEQAQNVATLEERNRLAREMHDSLAQVLGYLSMKAASARSMLDSGDRGNLDAQLAEMVEVADSAYLDVREAILGLRLSSQAQGHLPEAIKEYTSAFTRQSGIPVSVSGTDRIEEELPPRVEIQVVRVIQEALTNVRKHSGASRSWVNLERVDSVLRITVGDDGGGFGGVEQEREPGSGVGIQIMRERLGQIAGSLEISSNPGS